MIPWENRKDITDMSLLEKSNVLDATESGSIVSFPGHAMIYLGKDDKTYYCISAAGNFAPVQSSLGEVENVSSVVVNSLDVRRRNGKTWMESMTTVLGL
ncbi:MAG: hypothetical protein PHS82_00910 [Lachnospiraceae bacterium]|nr:hypothetical protein [Lachnospiraceae bacterium]